MTRMTTLLGTAALALALTTAAQAQDTTTEAPVADAPVAEAAPAPTADPAAVVATVDGTEITLGQMMIARAQLPQQYDQFPADVIYQGVLDQIVQQQLLSNSLTDVPARVGWAMANEERSLRAGEVITDLTKAAVTDEAIQAAYDEMVAAAAEEPVKEWNASHLLVETEEEAQAAKDRITAGEDFAEVAKEVSTGPSGPTGGELGWFGPGQMVAEFEQTVEGMEADDVSDPVQTQFGWHIVKLNETRDKPVAALEEVRAEIVGGLQEAVILSKIEELKAAATVTLAEPDAFDPAVLTNLDLLEK
ncbi:peptidylprolyl isomerase [Loktanella salsilacus]|jgi:peptidyl-prolyl cis-trans isomerase C|uniref:Parvulin-like PPIase n=1 Tax=Loktanella salsilacus TaxID=195913 RepID=A0A1I4F8P9_9RHOB|nr:peptidylprolyl isomerase [Loktanella salsilacus]UTH44353.1 peptidylprolyl isomerase [Loktanella salsilacus]UTH48073.1 peptidylprolyl isomerase [Loktanella salsilacus]SFL13670.1 peptidyl-prolyl cis-trans isomerase C [Loktanella salsilacus]